MSHTSPWFTNWFSSPTIPWYNVPEVARRCVLTKKEVEFLDQFKSLKEFAEVLSCCRGYADWAVQNRRLTVQDGIEFFHKSRQPRKPPKKSPLRYC